MKSAQSLVAPYVRGTNSRRAFTIIELLVVIAIIAILAAILFPVFGRARENARRSSCQSNVKQILLGVTQYTQDYDEKFPLIYQVNGAGALTPWFIQVQPYMKSTQIFRCPSDSTNTTLYGGVPNSYMANFAMGGLAPSSTGVSLSVLNAPSTTVYMCDGGSMPGTGTPAPANNSVVTSSTEKASSWILQDPQDAIIDGACPGCTTASDDPNWGGPRVRHLETTVVGFADGHVKSMRASQWYYNNTDWLDPAVGGK